MISLPFSKLDGAYYRALSIDMIDPRRCCGTTC
jgi:hypothetical protein